MLPQSRWTITSTQLAKDTADRRVELSQLEGLEEHRCVHSLKEKLDRWTVPVAGEENETLTGS